MLFGVIISPLPSHNPHNSFRWHRILWRRKKSRGCLSKCVRCVSDHVHWILFKMWYIFLTTNWSFGCFCFGFRCQLLDSHNLSWIYYIMRETTTTTQQQRKKNGNIWVWAVSFIVRRNWSGFFAMWNTLKGGENTNVNKIK